MSFFPFSKEGSEDGGTEDQDAEEGVAELGIGGAGLGVVLRAGGSKCWKAPSAPNWLLPL